MKSVTTNAMSGIMNSLVIISSETAVHILLYVRQSDHYLFLLHPSAIRWSVIMLKYAGANYLSNPLANQRHIAANYRKLNGSCILAIQPCQMSWISNLSWCRLC